MLVIPPYTKIVIYIHFIEIVDVRKNVNMSLQKFKNNDKHISYKILNINTFNKKALLDTFLIETIS